VTVEGFDRSKMWDLRTTDHERNLTIWDSECYRTIYLMTEFPMYLNCSMSTPRNGRVLSQAMAVSESIDRRAACVSNEMGYPTVEWHDGGFTAFLNASNSLVIFSVDDEEYPVRS
jgi:hypothetical protein